MTSRASGASWAPVSCATAARKLPHAVLIAWQEA
jgi:hypothetical protein